MCFNPRVSKTLKRIQQTSKTGALISQAQSLKRLLFFETGQLVGCRSSLSAERLGAILVREGRITKEQLTRAAENIRTGRKLGQLLVSLSYLNGGEIEGFVRLQILEVATKMLLEPCERLVFSEQVPAEAATLSPVSVAEVFLQSSRQLDDAERYRETILTNEFALSRVAEPPAPVERLDLSADETSVLELVNGVSSADEILKISPAGADTTVRTLVGLLHAGIVERGEKVPIHVEGDDNEDTCAEFSQQLERMHRRVQDQNHWAILGLEKGASYADITAAYTELRERFALDKFAHVPVGDLHAKIAFIQARAIDAFMTLSAESQTVAYEKLVRWEKDYESQREDWEKPESSDPRPEKDNAKANDVFQRAKESFQKQRLLERDSALPRRHRAQ